MTGKLPLVLAYQSMRTAWGDVSHWKLQTLLLEEEIEGRLREVERCRTTRE